MAKLSSGHLLTVGERSVISLIVILKCWTGVIFFIGYHEVGCLKCVQFHNWFRIHLTRAEIKKIRVQPYCFIFLLSSFFLLGSLYFSFAFPLLVWFLSLSGTEKPCLLALCFLTQECNGGKVCYLWFVCKRSARYIKTQWYVSVKRKVWFRK